MLKYIRKKWPLCLVLLFVLYLITGAAAPFLHYKEVSESGVEAFVHLSDLTRQGANDRAMLLETNQSAWEERIRLLNMAEERIILSTFDMREGESSRDILAMLYHKAEEGVSVKILVDGFSGAIRMQGNPLFYAASSHPNIEIKLYNPINILKPWTTQGRMHDKYVIVDDKAFILGGRNTMDYFIGEYPAKSRSFDREVLLYNGNQGGGGKTALTQVEDYFNQVWNLEVCRLFHDKESLSEKKRVKEMIEMLRKRYDTIYEENRVLFQSGNYYEENTVPVDGAALLSNPTGIYGKEPVLFQNLVELMKEAKQRVIIHTPYVVVNTAMEQSLKELKKEVPDCRIILNSIANGDNFCASSDYIYHKKDLIKVGIPLYEYDGGTSYHGKSVVIDDEIAIIGSYNLDLRSTYMDTELMLAIRSEELTKQLEANMEKIEKDCRLAIDEKTYESADHITVKKIPLWKKAALYLAGFVMQPLRFLL